MKFYKLPLLFTALSLVYACSNNDGETFDYGNDDENVFHIAADVTLNETAEVQIAPFSDLTTGKKSIVENGTQLDGVRSAYVAEANGMIYNLNYGTGVIRELAPNVSGTYDVTAEVDASVKLGIYPRFEVVGANNDKLMAFYVASETSADETEVSTTLQLVDYDLPGLNFRTSIEINLGTYKVGEIYINRVDAPVIHNGKLYIGTSLAKVGAARGEVYEAPNIQTIVLDYPSLDNLQIVKTTASSGHCYGYRGRSMYVEGEYVYQISWPINNSKPVITRLKDGVYDENYVLDITNALGGGSYATQSWFYIGGGVGYAAIEDKSIESENNWFIAHIDVNALTVQKINEIPLSDMWYYQNAVVTSGNTFNIAICPVGADAFIWQINGTSATKGAQLDGGNVFVQGIY